MNRKGFTLIEILLSLALIGIIASFSWPFFSSIQNNGVQADAERLANLLRQASVMAKTMNHDSDWGVLVDTGQMILFSGPSYADRNSAWDQIYDYQIGVSASSTQEIVFAKYSGQPSVSTTLTLKGDKSWRTVTLSSLGVVDY